MGCLQGLMIDGLGRGQGEGENKVGVFSFGLDGWVDGEWQEAFCGERRRRSKLWGGKGGKFFL